MPHTACIAGHKAKLDTENTTEHERTIKKCTILHPAPVSISDHLKSPDNLLKLFDTKNLVKKNPKLFKNEFFFPVISSPWFHARLEVEHRHWHADCSNMSSRPAHFRKGQETDHARQVQVPPQVHQATPMRSRSNSAPLLLFSRIRSRRGDRKPRRATGISLCAVSWIVENQLNIFLEKPIVFDNRASVSHACVMASARQLDTHNEKTLFFAGDRRAF